MPQMKLAIQFSWPCSMLLRSCAEVLTFKVHPRRLVITLAGVGGNAWLGGKPCNRNKQTCTTKEGLANERNVVLRIAGARGESLSNAIGTVVSVHFSQLQCKCREVLKGWLMSPTSSWRNTAVLPLCAAS
jgi:hypothetical protein